MILSPFSVALSFLSLTCALKHRDGKIATGWYAGWHAGRHATQSFPLEAVSWSKYTSLTYAFAKTTNDVNVLSLADSEPDVLPQFVAAAHENGVLAKVSIGGWTGSRFWSTAVGSAENRTAFVNTVTTFALEYDLDGLDFDWEYPNQKALGCNTIDANDTANYLLFLKELRDHPIGCELTLSAAVAPSPFMNSTGNPSEDVSEFASYLDTIVIMNYDLWGPWSATVGPNAALNDTCAAPKNQQGSAVLAVKRWTDAGFPRNQILLGLAAYGHSFAVTPKDAFNGTDTLQVYAPFNSSLHPAGDAWDDAGGSIDACGVAQLQGGVINFWGMVAQGYLDTDGEPAEGVPYIFDGCSQTPFVYNTTTDVMISFDNAESYAAKGEFIKDNSLAGFAIWEVGGDYNDILLDAVRSVVFDR